MMRTALILSLALLPGAAASGTVDAGFVHVSFDNGHTSDCIETTTGLCLAGWRGSGGSTTFDAIQEFRYVEVGVYDGEFESLVGVELLPDGAVRIDTDDLVLPNPAFRIVAENVGRIRGPGPLSDFAVAVTDKGYGLSFFGVWPHELPPEPGRYATFFEYNESKGLGYEHVRIFNTDQDASTDTLFHDLVMNPCRATDNGPCYDIAANVSSVQQSSTPEILVGTGVPAIAGEYQDEPDVTMALPRAEADGAPFRRNPTMPGSPVIHRHVDRSSDEVVLPPLPPSTGGEPAPREINARRLPPEAASKDVEADGPRPNAAFLFSAAAGFAIALLAAALYSRMTPDEALRSAARQRILAALDADGPQLATVLGRKLKMDRTTIEHHAQVLVRTGLAKFLRDGRHVLIALPHRTRLDRTRRSPPRCLRC